MPFLNCDSWHYVSFIDHGKHISSVNRVLAGLITQLQKYVGIYVRDNVRIIAAIIIIIIKYAAC